MSKHDLALYVIAVINWCLLVWLAFRMDNLREELKNLEVRSDLVSP